ncbi:hypothetical protein SVI_2637 [Shewanella violacea DSS12]|uniref:Uncharacterized protein n=1 Tax=Shewanella violacea (strain JCM 10179 / CIP 106290 / LMG 19151 / DSS12) TaxID=637905 RepID=D4ZLQ9_SHEVD|nr:hypothetical protein SVI_2637 [Shewanella violacea DSS12]
MFYGIYAGSRDSCIGQDVDSNAVSAFAALESGIEAWAFYRGKFKTAHVLYESLDGKAP